MRKREREKEGGSAEKRIWHCNRVHARGEREREKERKQGGENKRKREESPTPTQQPKSNPSPVSDVRGSHDAQDNKRN
jgi:hypothetical protein